MIMSLRLQCRRVRSSPQDFIALERWLMEMELFVLI